MKYRKASHTTYDCRYHIVWITKYRHPVLTKEIRKRLEIVIKWICKRQYINVLNIWMEEDHVHLYVSIPISKPIPEMVHKIKWATSKIIREEFKDEIKKYYWRNVLWARWYFVATVWEITDDIVKRYIDQQGKDEVLWDEVEL